MKIRRGAIDLVTAVLGVALLEALFTLQRVAAVLGAPKGLVAPKNPPPPGADGPAPGTLVGRLYGVGRRRLQACSDPVIVVFLAAEEIVAKWVAFLWDLMTLDGARLRHAPRQLMRQLRFAGAAVTTERSTAIQQAVNTRYIFELVRNNPELLGIPREGRFDLLAYLERAHGVGAFESIWSVEGLGHVYTQRRWACDWGAAEDASGILIEGEAAHLPPSTLTMLHAGLGLGFAEGLLKQLRPDADPAEVERVVAAFLRLCRANARPGYVGCAFESLGLVTRCFNVLLTEKIAAALANLDPTARDYFWRGVGRAIYFSPAHLIPPLCSPWIAAEQEADSPETRQALHAGIAWPASIVNMRTPAILERFILRHAVDPASEAAIVHGVTASATMAVDIASGASVIGRYLEHTPDPRQPGLAALWERLVHNPVEAAINRHHPILRQHGALEEVFRFQDLEALTTALETRLDAAPDARPLTPAFRGDQP